MLHINLRDGEQVVINGAVLRASGRVALCVENESAVLRGRDIMHPDEATTPARRAYLACMLAYIDPDAADAHGNAAVAHAADAFAAIGSEEAQALCAELIDRVAEQRLYQALGLCRALIRLEDDAIPLVAVAQD
ncbi:flagellar biosynthesis repressor FlbT [Sphingomonas sp. BK069]|uniref:flagellar biosynthesis repressor FlbT n=1 Tax=Sphingomonas sp. BK069 TaxID=2586979 RepID=UPI00160A11CA|nr:flagellar biosynthesis repressor FlbT [Sphingomonas sp. BK069]MBB3345789.1 flagellar protein FlbT [Sphingomonas sp. BK069]